MIGRIRSWVNQGRNYQLLDLVMDEVGYNRDVKIDEDLFEGCERLEVSSRTYVDKIVPDAKVYRDDKPTTSLHVTDFRETDQDGIKSHLEFFNPEYHPVLHVVDVLLWHGKNLIENREEKEIEP